MTRSALADWRRALDLEPEDIGTLCSSPSCSREGGSTCRLLPQSSRVQQPCPAQAETGRSHYNVPLDSRRLHGCNSAFRCELTARSMDEQNRTVTVLPVMSNSTEYLPQRRGENVTLDNRADIAAAQAAFDNVPGQVHVAGQACIGCKFLDPRAIQLDSVPLRRGSRAARTHQPTPGGLQAGRRGHGVRDALR